MRVHIPTTVTALLIAMAAITMFTEVIPATWRSALIFYLGSNLFSELGQFTPWRLVTTVTAIFLHAGWIHLLANGLWLVVLGPPIHARLRDARFMTLFIASGVAGNLTHAAFNWPRFTVVIGASGAVFGLLGAGAYVLTRSQDGGPPKAANILHYVLMMLVLMAGYAIVVGRGVSWEAHAGGFAAGLILYPFLRPRGRPGPRPLS